MTRISFYVIPGIVANNETSGETDFREIRLFSTNAAISPTNIWSEIIFYVLGFAWSAILYKSYSTLAVTNVGKIDLSQTWNQGKLQCSFRIFMRNFLFKQEQNKELWHGRRHILMCKLSFSQRRRPRGEGVSYRAKIRRTRLEIVLKG